jgi:hypothetical protein
MVVQEGHIEMGRNKYDQPLYILIYFNKTRVEKRKVLIKNFNVFSHSPKQQNQRDINEVDNIEYGITRYLGKLPDPGKFFVLKDQFQH